LKTLLFVTDVVLLPLDRGQRLRVINLIRAAAAVFEVTLVAPQPEDPRDRQAILDLCPRVRWVPDASAVKLDLALIRTAVRAALGMKRWKTVRRYLPLAAALREINLDRFDLIWAERVHVARLFSAQRARTVIDLDDIEHRKIRRRLRLARQPLAIVCDLYRCGLYLYGELRWTRRFLASVVCSDEDRDYLMARGCRGVVTVANGVDANGEQRPAQSGTSPGSVRMVFLGHLASEPNLDAIDYFVEHVLPLVRASDPGATFEVIGGGITARLRDRYAEQVIFRGFVPDLRMVLPEYDVFVAPLRFGSGTKVKLLDAMVAEVPIVTTAVGAEGLTIVDGEHALLAESPADLARQILSIKRTPELGARLKRNARQLVEDRFSWSAIRHDASEWLRQIHLPPPESSASRRKALCDAMDPISPVSPR
jgi:glycosyltransferase involved in cell wall biosynthesis